MYSGWYEEEPQAEQFQRYEEEQHFTQQRSEEQPVPEPEPSPKDTGTFPIPAGPGRMRDMGAGGGTELTEEDCYLVFKKSTDGSCPTSDQFKGDVEATYGITLPQREAERMANPFHQPAHGGT
ncbi:hypothetical protein ABTY96_47130 [Streptomyces sp. NPDC096057]|uniref:hypothetical protein n=1 Tax=Streptomyces sp. NPDC096057 TaxID=3155543 RepID=UPI003318AE07